MSMNRNTLPVSLPGATEFSSEPEMLNEMWAIEILKQYPQWLTPLLEGTDLDSNFGRPRIQGRWALAYLAFVVSRQVDVEPWHANSQETTWLECGFQGKPTYWTTWSRFAELEDAADAFSGVVALLVQHAQKHTGGLVGRDIHVDATEAETHSRLIHDCQGSKNCGRRAKYPIRATNAEVRALRHKHSVEPPTDDPDIGDADEIEEDENGRVRIRVGTCWYRTMDPSAGVRAYTTTRSKRVKRFWHGFYNMKSIDHYTGAPISIHLFSASTQEYHGYPALLEQTIETLGGEKPRSVVADRGLSIASVFELNTTQGIASVSPYRRKNQNDHRENNDTERYDRHGVPRCQRCGGPSTYHSFAAKPNPRLWFKCEVGVTPECEKIQTIACSFDWKTLVPLWRTEEAYFALKESHGAYERAHHLFRTRYRVGADNHALRPKRIGLGCQQLRANAVLRILHRQNWLGSARRNARKRAGATSHERVHHGLGLRKLMSYRNRIGLQRPYGPNAVALQALGLLKELEPENMLRPPPGDKDDRPF
jgi:hypothetical protein